MNHKATAILLGAIDPYVKNSNVEISKESTKGFRPNNSSDFVVIDKRNNVGFEVFENEIIVYYFTDHQHFDDYIGEVEDGDEDYIKRAEEFLIQLLTNRIRHIEYYKGKKKYSEKYYFIYDNKNDEDLGGTWYGLSRVINPFAKKSSQSKTWQFDVSKGIFTNRRPKTIDPEAIESIYVNDDCYVEIYERNNLYSYSVTETAYDDYYGEYYWSNAIAIVGSGIYDTKEKAVKEALEAIKNRDKLFNMQNIKGTDT